MAVPDAESPAEGGFSLTKRYGPLPAWGWGLLGGAGIYAVWRWRQNKNASTAATMAAGTADTQQTDYAPQISTIQSEVQQLQQGENGEAVSTPVTTDKDTTTGGGGSRPPAGKKVRIPDVAGKRVAFAIDELHSEGLAPVTNPLRNPRSEYIATGTTPKAGTEVPRGTRVVIAVRHEPATRRTANRTGSPRPPGVITTPRRKEPAK